MALPSNQCPTWNLLAGNCMTFFTSIPGTTQCPKTSDIASYLKSNVNWPSKPSNGNKLPWGSECDFKFAYVNKNLYLHGIYANGNGKVYSQSSQSQFGGVFEDVEDMNTELYFQPGVSGYFGASSYNTIWQSESNFDTIPFVSNNSTSRSVYQYHPNNVYVSWSGSQDAFDYITWELKAGNTVSSTNTTVASGNLYHAYGGTYMPNDAEADAFYLTYQYTYYNLYFMCN